MPTYEYACRGCEHRFEIVQSFSDAALTTCETCGGELRKVFSAAGLIFKGSGWHIKDYSSSSSSTSSTSTPKPTSESSESSSSSSSGSSDTTSSSKPAATSAPAKSTKKDSSSPKPAASA